MKVKNKNKSKNQTLHKCDFCGSDPEEMWSGHKIDGQYCFEHFRLMHDDLEEFDEWCKRFIDEKNSDNPS
jgi:hypothetical protein